MKKKVVLCAFRRLTLAVSASLLVMLAGVTPASAKDVVASVNQVNKTVTGTVSDKTGTLPGVTVIIKGTTTGAVTDIDGNFTLNASPADVLVFSFIGYKAQEVVVGNQTTFNIVLQDDNQQLDEVVIVGYGSQKKVNVIGSVASVGANEIKGRVNTDVMKAVQGTVAGVTIISRPGSTPSINFRGRGNLGTSSPLYVIDGAISDASFFSSLDPNSIESISFLKDAASSAIYGARAAYGVVLVKTKGGKEGDMTVSYSGYAGVKMPTYISKVVSSGDYASLLKEAELNTNPLATPTYSDEEIEMFYNGTNPDMYPNTNWFDLVLDKAVATTQHGLNISGGSEKIKYFAGLGYVYDDNFMPGQSTNRYNFTTTVNADVKKWLTFNTSVKYIYNKFKRTTQDPGMITFLNVAPTYVAKHTDGSWGTYNGGKVAPKQSMTTNPLRKLTEGGWGESDTKNTMMDLGFDIKPISGLVLTGQFIYKGYNYESKSYSASMPELIDFKTGNAIAGTGVSENKMSITWSTNNRLIYNGLVRYDKDFGAHKVNVLAGMSYEHYTGKQIYGYRKGFVTNEQTDIDAGSNAQSNMYFGSTSGNTGGDTENKMLSYFGRVNYSYMDRYLFEANLRSDASSRFYKDNRWGIFPSFSAGWRMNQEAFLADVTWLSNLKIRASWGTLGNINNVGDYDYFDSYSMGNNYNFEDVVVNGVIEAKPANRKLSWETVTITDFGIDADFFEGKLGVVADYYVKNTNDILLAYNIPTEVGISSSPSQNMGKVQNKGLELALSHNNQIGDFSYTISGNISKNWNKIKDLGDSDPMYQGKWILKEGQSIGTFFGYKSDGLLTQDDIDNGRYVTSGNTVPNAGDIKYVSKSGGNKLTEADRTYLGSDVPDFTYGANVHLQYKNFELSVFGQGVQGVKVAFSEEQAWAFFDNATPREFHKKRWTKENPNPKAAYTRLYDRTSPYNKHNQLFSDYWLFNADYFRIKNITFGYQVPTDIVNRLNISSLKFFVTGENLFTVRGDKRMEDFDPESPSGRGLGALGVRSVAVGVNLTF